MCYHPGQNVRVRQLNLVLVLHVIPTTSILQSTTELGFSPSDVMNLAITAMIAGGLSAVFLPRIQKWLGVTNLQVLAWSICHTLIYLMYGASSVVNSNWGYQSKTSVYVLLVYMGFVSRRLPCYRVSVAHLVLRDTAHITVMQGQSTLRWYLQ